MVRSKASLRYSSKVDAYIAAAQPFAQPILKHLRNIVHAACPQTQEAMKWGMPFFNYNGKILCHMAAFRQHAVFGFWKAKLMPDPKKIFTAPATAMGNLGRIRSAADLPPAAVLKQYIKVAMKLNDASIVASGSRRKTNKRLAKSKVSG